MKEGKLVLAILSIAVFIFIAFYLVTRDVTLPDNQAMPWQSYVNDQGETVVFNLTMGTSTLTDAMRLFGTEVEASLFEEDNNKKDLEVFFSSTKVGGISAKVILNLDLNSQQLTYLNNNIKETDILPTGNKKISFNQAGETSMFDLAIIALTFIPMADLSADALIDLFKKPSRVERAESGVEYWHYPSKGLRIIVDTENKEILEFYTP